jgi:FkbM family methyltransferase
MLKCVVLTPVGPGHEALMEQARASVEAACRTGLGPFSEVSMVPLMDLEGAHGRSNRRNDGINYALAKGFDWIYFLDADDLMPRDAFTTVAPYVEQYDAIFGQITQVVHETGEILVRPKQLGFTTSVTDILMTDPFLSVQMEHFVRTRVAAAVRFDAEMDTGEDFKYYLEIWRQFRAVKLDRTIGYHRRGLHSTGPRSANGLQWQQAVAKVFEEYCSRNPTGISFTYEEKQVKFHLSSPMDWIQRHFLAGTFFEYEELGYLRRIVPPQAAILEVGANIGNHLVYYGLFMNPRTIVPFEPNPKSIACLKANVALNQLEMTDLSLLGIGVGDRYGHFDVCDEDSVNLGAAGLVENAKGQVEVFPLDAKYTGPADFMKIDVEGMELEVLRGAEQLIRREQPILFVEVMNANEEAFSSWMAEHGYTERKVFANVHAKNHVIAPASRILPEA